MDDKTFKTWESNIRGYCHVYPTVFKTAKNAHQIDEDGRSYIDFFAGAGVLNFGHNNPKMKEAIISYLQEDGIAHSLDTYTTAKRDFIEAFTSTILEPRHMDYKLQFMGPTGTNAVEAALKLARKVTGRGTVFAFTRGFHGMTLGSLACTANDYFRQAAGVPLEYVHRLPFEDPKQPEAAMAQLQDLRNMLNDPSSGLKAPAAILVESIQAEGGVNVASAEWLQEVQAIANEHGALFIIDDIQAGCGRTGNYFSFEDLGVQPDIVTLAKGIGGFGTPMAMNLIKPEHDKWSPGEHTGTFRGQNISFVAGTVAMDYFKDDVLMDTVKAYGEKIAEILNALAKKHSDKGFEVRGKGMMQALDVQDGQLAKDITAECFKNGLLIGPCGPEGRVLKLIPPLTIEEETLTQGLEIFAQAVENKL